MTNRVDHSPPRQVCLFETAGLQMGIETSAVLEILAPRPFTVVPLAADDVRGLLNLRGTLVTVIDLGRRLGAPPTPVETGFHVVIEHSLGATSLMVDDVRDIIEVPADDIEAPPATLDATTLALVGAMAKLDAGLLLFLDPEAAAAVPDQAEGP